jgi:hypothetical protein
MAGIAPCKVHGEPSGLEFVLRARRRSCQTHYDEADDTGGARTLDDGLRPFAEVVGIQMAVRVRNGKHDAAGA